MFRVFLKHGSATLAVEGGVSTLARLRDLVPKGVPMARDPCHSPPVCGQAGVVRWIAQPEVHFGEDARVPRSHLRASRSDPR